MKSFFALIAAAILAASSCEVARQGTEPRPAGEAAAAAPAPAAPAGGGEPKGWLMPVPAQGYNVREGRATFLHYCATCHGEAGQGDGLNAYNLDPKPRDLSDAAFQQQRSDDDLVAVIRSGGGAAGLSAAMPPWGRSLKEREIRNVVMFVRALRAQAE